MRIHPHWATRPEQMGSKDKFWFRDPDDPNECDWLFKLPTDNTGQHWAEKVAYEIARRMRILAPIVELTECQLEDSEPSRGSSARSFASGYELYHGNQVLAGMDDYYDPEQRFGQSMHTVQRIFNGMSVFASDAFAERCRIKLAEYFVFDAVIGNVDRHHENWGILCKLVDGRMRGRLAPTFDHASSLGRELVDAGGRKSRRRYLNEIGIERYVERAHGAVYWGEDSTRGPSPLDLVRRCVEQPEYQVLFRRAVRRVDYLTTESVEEIVSKVPGAWMTELSKAFAVSLVDYNLRELRLLL